MLAYTNRVSLSATGFYKTPDLAWDRIKGKASRSSTLPKGRRDRSRHRHADRRKPHSALRHSA